jgi:hypothetical protein
MTKVNEKVEKQQKELINKSTFQGFEQNVKPTERERER